MHATKYARSLHAHVSLGTTSDDRFLPPGYVEAFSRMGRLVLTEKLDGQNNCFSRHGLFARTHATPSAHPWDEPLRQRWTLIKDQLGELEVFGENMYGVHSIAYRGLESYFYVFAVREGDRWLSWEEVKFYAAMLDFPTAPEIEVNQPLRDFVAPNRSENDALQAWLTANLGQTWLDHIAGPGCLGGYDPPTGNACCEGFVVRNAAEFKTNTGTLPVATNEFDNLFKLVRPAHVKTDVHWTKTWRPATLTEYSKYRWHAHAYLQNHGS